MARKRMADAQWKRIEDLFPPPAETGRPPADRRQVLDGIFWILRTGSPWRDLPEEFGAWQTVWRLFDQWNADGTLDAVKDRLSSDDVDGELWCADGTVVRAHRCAAGGGKEDAPDEPEDHALGRSRGGFTTNIHWLCDGRGEPLHFHLTPGQTHDSSVFDRLMIGADEALPSDGENAVPWPKAIAGDKGYRANWIDEYLLEMGITPVIPSKKNEDPEARGIEFDRTAYRRRNIVERLIGWLKEFRRVFSRFEKTAKNFGGMIKMAIIQRSLRQVTE